MTQCPNCKFENNADAIECQKCGIIFKKYKQQKVDQAQSLLTRCNACGNNISKNANSCPQCGEPNTLASPALKMSNTEKIKSKGKPSLVIVLGGGFIAFCVFIIIFGELLGLEKSPPKNVTIHRTAMPGIPIDATVLLSDYQANEVRADEQYKGRMLVISGYIDTIGKDIVDDIYITLKTKNPIFKVQCFFDKRHTSTLANLKIGEFVKVRGRCNGKFGNVLVKDCILQ